MRNQIIAGLDLGSTEVKLVVGQKIFNDYNSSQLQIIGAVSIPAEGINKGVVNSIEDATSSISAGLEKIERLIGATIGNAWVGLNMPGLKCERSRGVVAVSRSDNEINQDDINRVIEAAQALVAPPNYDVLHVVPVSFTVDNQEYVKNPLGMVGVRLEVETLVIQNLTNQIKNLTKSIQHAGVAIDDLIFSPLAAASVVLTPKQKELGVALINFGATTTSLAIFEEGEVIYTAVLPIGSSHITSDIAIGLRCPITLAEKIKIKYGSAKPDQFDKKDEIDISDLLSEENLSEEVSVISRKYVAEIIEARTEEILEKIDQEFKQVDRSAMLPAGVVFIGGGAKLADLVELAKKRLRLPVSLGVNRTVATISDRANDLEYLNALGLVVWGDQATKHEGYSDKSMKNVFKKGKDVLGKLFASFKP